MSSSPLGIRGTLLTHKRMVLKRHFSDVIDSWRKGGNPLYLQPEDTKLNLKNVRGQGEESSTAKRRSTESKLSRTIDLVDGQSSTRLIDRNRTEQPRHTHDQAQQCHKTFMDLTEDVLPPEQVDRMRPNGQDSSRSRGQASENLAARRQSRIAKEPARFRSRWCFLQSSDEEKAVDEADDQLPRQNQVDISSDSLILDDHNDHIDEDHLGRRRSTRRSRPTRSYAEFQSPDSQRRVERVDLGKPWQYSISYPLQGLQPAHVDFVDLERLNTDEMLNDSLIDFYARWLRQKHPDKANSVYFFNTYFHTILSQEGYSGVSKWTKKIDLFTYDHILVPVNFGLHWYLAIICNLPSINRKFCGTPEAGKRMQPVDLDSIEDSPSNTKARAHDTADSTPRATKNPTSATYFDLSSPTTISSPGRPRPGSAKQSGKRRKSGPPPRKYDLSEPIIIFLDSMGFKRDSRLLKSYIVDEGMAKREMDIDIKEIKGMNATGIAQQDNTTDCGLYVILYMAMFMRDPDAFVGSILQKSLDERDDWEVDSTRMRADFRDLLRDIYKEQEPLLAKLIKGRKKRRPEDRPPANPVPPTEPLRLSPPKDSQPAVQASGAAVPAGAVAGNIPTNGVDLSHAGDDQTREVLKLSSAFRTKFSDGDDDPGKEDIERSKFDREIPETPPSTQLAGAARANSLSKRMRSNSASQDPLEDLSQQVE